MKIVIVLASVVLCCQASVLKFEQSQIFKSVVSKVLGEQEDSVLPEQNDVSTDEKPWFCHDLGCPAFKVIQKEKEYELREYEMTSWVTTALTGVSLDDAMSKMFMKLFNYISGDNVQKEKIAMTCPVIVRIIPGPGPACESNFTMSFFNIPGKNPPKPSADDVTLTTLPKLRAYVRSFGGWGSEKKYIEEASELAAALPDSASYVKDFYYTAGYDAPFTIFNRHNEVWFIAN